MQKYNNFKYNNEITIKPTFPRARRLHMDEVQIRSGDQKCRKAPK